MGAFSDYTEDAIGIILDNVSAAFAFVPAQYPGTQ